MRTSLIYNPFALVERLAIASRRYQRRRILRGTPAQALSLGHIDSLELLQLLGAVPPAVVHDIGANAGTWTCLVKSLFPAARVEAFEPLPRFRSEFASWTAAWPNDVHLHSLALGSAPSESNLHVTSFADASSLLALNETGQREFKVAPAETVRVQVERLDDLVAQGRVAAPNLLKLDVQGYELEVLRGAETCLAQTAAILCEVSTQVFYDGQPLFGEILHHLEQRGFRLHALGANLNPGEPFAQTDALFLKQ